MTSGSICVTYSDQARTLRKTILKAKGRKGKINPVWSEQPLLCSKVFVCDRNCKGRSCATSGHLEITRTNILTPGQHFKNTFS